MTKKPKGEPTEEEWDSLTTLILKRMVDDGLIENGKLTEKGRKALAETYKPKRPAKGCLQGPAFPGLRRQARPGMAADIGDSLRGRLSRGEHHAIACPLRLFSCQIQLERR